MHKSTGSQTKRSFTVRKRGAAEVKKAPVAVKNAVKKATVPRLHK